MRNRVHGFISAINLFGTKGFLKTAKEDIAEMSYIGVRASIC